MHVSCVVGYLRSNRGIGAAGKLLWDCPADLKHFRAVTCAAPHEPTPAIIMGYRTWLSLPTKPLPHRINVVLTRNHARDVVCDVGGGTIVVAQSYEEALARLRGLGVANVYVIGGESVYREALAHPATTWIYATEFDDDGIDAAAADCFFPSDPNLEPAGFESDLHECGALRFRFVQYGLLHEPDNHVRADPDFPDIVYAQLARRILHTGEYRSDRTGTGTLSLFGEQLRFALTDGRMPLLSTKRVFWRGVVEELFWMLGGKTDARQLAKRKVHIWDANGSRAFLDKCGFPNRPEGDLGPIYGFQWRHFGAEYRGTDALYANCGVDQVRACLRLIREDPWSRRILLTAWNPTALSEMALPPCHVLCQFQVQLRNGERELSCHMFQRSCDVMLGLPFNIASYALLTVLFAHVTDLRPGELVVSISDAHVYTNHVAAIKQQLTREPYTCPRVRITRATTDIDALTPDDVALEGYRCHPAIAAPMAV